MHRLSDTV
ncbi:hypothetical protein EC950183_2116, partial [Escherichia coli 95.0183]